MIGALSLSAWAALTSFIYFKGIDMLGRLRINRFYEIVGIDTLMHTMSDQIGENDDFDRESRNFQSQNEIFRQKYKKQNNE
jgi:hypothetical protein